MSSSLVKLFLTPVVLTATIIQLQIDAFQHMQHFVQTMQQQAQHAIATEDQQHKQELHKLMARSAPGPWTPFSYTVKLMSFLRLQGLCRCHVSDKAHALIKRNRECLT